MSAKDPEIHIAPIFPTAVPSAAVPIASSAPVAVSVPLAVAVPVDDSKFNNCTEQDIVVPGTGTADSNFKDTAIIFEELNKQGFSKGLIDSLIRNTVSFPLRIWVIDNSGSMRSTDGQRIVAGSSKNDLRFERCTRWSEIQQCVPYHAQLSHLMNSPTIYRLLNHPGADVGPQQFSVANGEGLRPGDDLAQAQNIMKRAQPEGYTPLNQHLTEIIQHVESMAPELRKSGQKVAVIIATDGVPSDCSKTEFIKSLKGLGRLPVWLVFRLCTDYSSVVDYFGDLDKLLEEPVEVLDDFSAEAQEVYNVNKWINYALPIHRMRELGFEHRLFDLIDERKLTKDEVYEYCQLLFGNEAMHDCPSSVGNWDGFKKYISKLSNIEPKPWNPVTKRVESWISVPKLEEQYEGRIVRPQYGGGSADAGCCVIS